MKNTRKFIGFTAIIAVIALLMTALSMTGCPAETKSLTSIAVTEQPTKKIYKINDTFDPAGMVVTGLYSDASTEVIDNSKLAFDFDSSTAGAKNVTIKYQGIAALTPVPVTVLPAAITDPAKLESIKVTTPPTKLQYNIGDVFNPAGMVVTAYLTDGTTTTVTAGWEITGFDSSTLGRKTITVTFLEKSTEFSVNVVNPNVATVAAPTAAPAAGNLSGTQAITLATTTAGATIYYTIDGTEPTRSSTAYTNPISISTATTIKAFAVKADMNDSNILTAVYSFTVVTPAASPAAGSFPIAQTVTLSTTTDGAAIYYTTDGTDPTDESALYDSAISISATTTIKAIAVKEGFENSGIFTAAYTIYTPVEMPTADRWYDGTLTSAVKEQWFKFTATATTQYIHFQAGTMTAATLQLYEADAATTNGTSSYISSSSSASYISRTLVVGNVYYLKVSTSLLSGAYKIGFNTTSSSPSVVTIPTAGVTDLTIGDKWTDGNIPEAGGEQWFKFTTATGTSAGATSVYIHFLPSGSLYGAYVQMYTASGGTQGARESFTTSTSTLYVQRTGLTAGTVYYIRVTPYLSTYSGTYRIGVNSSTTRPSITLPTEGVTALSANTWKDGSLTETAKEEWFKFTATGTPAYIYFQPGALSSIYFQLYSDAGAPVGSRSSLSDSTIYAPPTGQAVTSNSVYYVMVMPYSSTVNSGAYKIAFGTSTTAPSITLPSGTVPELTADTWADGSITAAGGGVQWFKFTATATTHYIHFLAGTGTGALSNVYVLLYKDDGTNAGTPTNLYTSGTYDAYATSQANLTVDSTYYIKVWPFNSTSTGGTYKIAFNTAQASPVITPSPVPTTGVTQLTADTFADGSIAASGGEQWFKFTAAAATQYVYFLPGTLTSVYAQLYTTDSRKASTKPNLSVTSFSTTPYASATYTVTNNTEYYIRVTPSSGSGTFRIGFNSTSATPPPSVTPPTESSYTEITAASTWAEGNITTAGGEQWFKFTATANTAYIHFLAGLSASGGLNDVNVQLYSDDGRTVGSRSNRYNYNGGIHSTTSITVSNGSVYYIRVWPYYTSNSGSSTATGTYKLAFTATSTAPAAP